MTRDRVSKRPLSVERLEDRQLLAGNVLANVQGQTLTIVGDGADNGIVLTYNGATKTFRVTGQEAGEAVTKINGAENHAEFQHVKQIAVSLGAGNDKFEIGSPQAVDAVISKWLTIDAGDGNDEVILGRSGNGPGGVEPLATSLRVGTTLTVGLGAGDDKLQIAKAYIGLALNIFAGDGNDEILFDTDIENEANVQIVDVRGNTNINLGGGDDELVLHHAALNGHLIIDGGAGIASIDLYNLRIRKKLDIDTGGEADEIKIDFVNARPLTIDSNGGGDDIEVTNSRFRTMILKLGDGPDQLKLEHVKSSWFTRLDGGPDGSALERGPGTKLRFLSKRNMS